MSVLSDHTVSRQGGISKMTYWLLSFVFFVIIFIFVVYYFSEIRKEFALLEKVRLYWLAIAVCAQFATYVFTAMIYLFLLRAYDVKPMPRLNELTKASIIALFFNQTMSSAGISGNAFFTGFLLRFNMAVGKIISLILTELLIFYGAMEVIIVALFSSSMFFHKQPHAVNATLAAGLVVYFVLGVAIAFAGRKNFFSRLFDKIGRMKPIKRIIKNLKNKIGQQNISLSEVRFSTFIKNNKRTAGKAFVFQFLVHAADALTIYALFWGLGVHISPFIVILSFICTKIISILPFLPGALILYESSMSLFFASLGIPIGPAIMATLTYRFLSFWLPMPAGFLLYRKWLRNGRADG